MTTTTIVPTIPAAELEAWLAGEIEKPCQMYRRPTSTSECARPAAWLISGNCDSCGVSRSKYCCELCHRYAANKGVYEHVNCGGTIRITWVERIKGGAS